MSQELPDMLTLFGKRYDDPAVTAFLASCPIHKAERPSDGAQYIVSKPGGFDFLFNDDTNRGAGHRQNRTLNAIFLYREGVDGHQRFFAPLPFGFAWDVPRASRVAQRTPDRTWVIGEGRVPVTHPAPDHDQWAIDDLTISAHYDDDGTTVRYFIVSPPSDAPEWTPTASDTPPSWQTLALQPDRKLDAIKRYREEHGGGMAAAKAAVEHYVAAQ